MAESGIKSYFPSQTVSDAEKMVFKWLWNWLLGNIGIVVFPGVLNMLRASFRVSLRASLRASFLRIRIQNENLILVSDIHIKEKELRKQKINKLISQFEFEALLNIKAKDLSGGLKKKLVIAMALINDPKILL